MGRTVDDLALHARLYSVSDVGGVWTAKEDEVLEKAVAQYGRDLDSLWKTCSATLCKSVPDVQARYRLLVADLQVLIRFAAKYSILKHAQALQSEGIVTPSTPALSDGVPQSSSTATESLECEENVLRTGMLSDSSDSQSAVSRRGKRKAEGAVPMPRKKGLLFC